MSLDYSPMDSFIDFGEQLRLQTMGAKRSPSGSRKTKTIQTEQAYDLPELGVIGEHDSPDFSDEPVTFDKPVERPLKGGGFDWDLENTGAVIEGVGAGFEAYGALRAGQKAQKNYDEMADFTMASAREQGKQIAEDRETQAGRERLAGAQTGLFTGQQSYQEGTGIAALQKHNNDRAKEVADRIMKRAENRAARLRSEGIAAKKAGKWKAAGKIVKGVGKLAGGFL